MPEIASELYLSVHTVRTHMRHVYDKLGVHRRAETVERPVLSACSRRPHTGPEVMSGAVRAWGEGLS